MYNIEKQLSEKREKYMEKAPRCKLKSRQYCLIGLEFVQRKLGISLKFKHYCTVRYSPCYSAGQYSTKSVYSTISIVLQSKLLNLEKLNQTK